MIYVHRCLEIGTNIVTVRAVAALTVTIRVPIMVDVGVILHLCGANITSLSRGSAYERA